MKVAALVCLILLALTALASMPALAQTVPHFQHIVLIIQENRTPDNLFGAGSSHPICGHEDAFETGVDIQDGGYPEGGLTPLCLTSTNLQVCWDIDHSHEAWNTQADIDPSNHLPHMDGACMNSVDAATRLLPTVLNTPSCRNRTSSPTSTSRPTTDSQITCLLLTRARAFPLINS